VPAGKTLYITDAVISTQISGYYFLNGGGIVFHGGLFADSSGRVTNLSRPVRVDAGESLVATYNNTSGVAGDVNYIVLGWEV
jgi:hypothetical protein